LPHASAAGITLTLMQASAKTLMQIGEAAAKTDLSLRTLRHWDNVGLVKPSERSVGGFRLYSEADLERIRVIKSMKPLALSLEETRELLELLETLGGPRGATPEHASRLKHYTERTRACMSHLHRDLAYATHLLQILESLQAGVI
jgi:MerR family transcriptional regulator, copper efflux regulator